ncbi:MAG: glycosyltransferase [Patescibacteria group bacterium]
MSIQIVVHNGQSYVRDCLRRVYAQTYPTLEVVVLDNASTDATCEIIQKEFPQATLNVHGKNVGMWLGQDYLLSRTKGKYVLALSADVVLDKDFITRAIPVMESDARIGALQSKMYQWDGGAERTTTTLDTCGFALTRSRKVVNIGHGQADAPQYARQRELFAAEGAAPLFRREALEDIRIEGRIADPDYFWYGDDLDMGWRMHLFGWKQIYAPNVVAWHDRSTTKGAAHSFGDVLKRVAVRRRIPLQKRRWDWSNVRFTIIKNDYILNILGDMPWILAREVGVFFYTLLVEPKVFLECGRFLRLLPRMWHRRQLVMAKATVPPREMGKWFRQSSHVPAN